MPFLYRTVCRDSWHDLQIKTTCCFLYIQIMSSHYARACKNGYSVEKIYLYCLMGNGAVGIPLLGGTKQCVFILR